MATANKETREPDIVIDNERFTARVYFGERSEEERMRVIKEATAEFFREIRPELIRLGLLDHYVVKDGVYIKHPT